MYAVLGSWAVTLRTSRFVPEITFAETATPSAISPVLSLTFCIRISLSKTSLSTPAIEDAVERAA